MANPQPDKFTRLSSELLNALCRTRVSGEARQVFDAIMRKTYGFHKKEDFIAISQISEATGLSKRSAERGKAVLVNLGMITTVKIDGVTVHQVAIQKDYKRWKTYNPTPTDMTVKDTDKIDGRTPTNLVNTPTDLQTPVPTDLQNTKDKKILLPKIGEKFDFQVLKREIKDLRKLGWDSKRIKSHLKMREIPEFFINKALEKEK